MKERTCPICAGHGDIETERLTRLICQECDGTGRIEDTCGFATDGGDLDVSALEKTQFVKFARAKNRIEKLEKDLEHARWAKRVHAEAFQTTRARVLELEAENLRLREALEWYSDHWCDSREYIKSKGFGVARNVLGEEEQ